MNMDKKRIRFTYDDEMILLREFIAQNPIRSPEKWDSILQNLRELTGKEFILRTIKKHLNHLLELFLKKEVNSKVKSGIEEVYNEREHMLQEASELMKETCSTTPAKKKKVENKAKDMIEKTRNEREAMALLAFSDVDDTLIDHDYGVCVTVDVDTENNNKSVQDVGTAKQISVQDVGTAKQISVQDVGTAKQISVQDVGTAKQISAPRTKRMNKSKTLRKNGLDYLREKAEISREIRSAELKLEEQKMDNEKEKIANDKARLALESKRLEAEIQEKKHRIELEQKKSEQDVAERKNLSDLIKTQQKLIEALLTKLDNR